MRASTLAAFTPRNFDGVTLPVDAWSMIVAIAGGKGGLVLALAALPIATWLLWRAVEMLVDGRIRSRRPDSRPSAQDTRMRASSGKAGGSSTGGTIGGAGGGPGPIRPPTGGPGLIIR